VQFLNALICEVATSFEVQMVEMRVLPQSSYDLEQTIVGKQVVTDTETAEFGITL